MFSENPGPEAIYRTDICHSPEFHLFLLYNAIKTVYKDICLHADYLLFPIHILALHSMVILTV